MNLASAPEKVEAVKGPKAAARLYNEIEFELALGDATGDVEAAGEQALLDLEQRWPGVKDQARDIDRPPSLSHEAGKNLDKQRHVNPPPHRPRARRGSQPRPPATRRPGGNPRPNRARTGSSLLDLPSIDAGSGGQMLVQFFAWGMGLSLLYLFLTHDKAATGLFSGLANTTRAVVAVGVDPLNPHGVPVRPHHH